MQNCFRCVEFSLVFRFERQPSRVSCRLPSHDFPEFPAACHRRFPAAFEGSLLPLLRLEVPRWSRSTFTDRFCISKPLPCVMPTFKILALNKSSRRRLNTGSALTSRQEATPAEMGPSTSSTLSVSLRGQYPVP